MTRRKKAKTTVYLDPDLLRAVKMRAIDEGRHDYEIYEAALRAYLAPEDDELHDAILRAIEERMTERE